MIKFSFIVPVYNVERYLHRCINSILNQGYDDLELILIDDGSTDNSGNICDEYATRDTRVRAVHQNNQGSASARNAGIRLACGEYITFVDGDDFVDQNFCDLALKYFPYDILFCGHKLVENGKVCAQKCASTVDREYLVKSSIYGYVWGKIFSAKLIKDLLFEEKALLREDMIFVNRAMRISNKVVLASFCPYYYIFRDDSILHASYNGKIPDNMLTSAILMQDLTFCDDSRMNKKLSVGL